MTKKSKKLDTNIILYGVIALLVVIIVAVLLTGQSPEAQQEEIEIPEEPETPQEAADIPEEPEPEDPVEQILRNENEDILELYARSDQVKSQSFDAVRVFTRDGANQGSVLGKYEVRGDLARVRPSSLLSMDGWSADYVYLNLDENRAVAYCIDLACQNENLKGEVDFDDYDIPLPMEWQNEISYGEIIGDLHYNQRPAKVVRWENDGLYWEAYVDVYYGVPMRVVAANDAERSDIVRGWEYRSISFNSVGSQDVEAPY